MAIINFDLRAYIFQESVKVLRTSYEDAEAAVEAKLLKAYEETAAYQESLENGGEWIGERDDDGYVIWDHETVLEMQAEEADEALQSLRKAFAISAYHLWERSARRWTGSSQGLKHDQLVDRVKGESILVDVRLSAVRDLANLLKHANAKWGGNLRHSWPDLLEPKWRGTKDPSDWYQAVRLEKAHLHEVLDVVASSGPRDAKVRLSPD